MMSSKQEKQIVARAVSSVTEEFDRIDMNADPATIRKEESMVKMWPLADLKANEKEKSAVGNSYLPILNQRETALIPYDYKAADLSCWNRYSASSGAGTSMQAWNADRSPASLSISHGYYRTYCQAKLCYGDVCNDNLMIGNPDRQSVCPNGFSQSGLNTCHRLSAAQR